MIKDLVSIELAYINTSHPDFKGSSGVHRAAMAPRAEQSRAPTANAAAEFGALGRGPTSDPVQARASASIAAPRAGANSGIVDTSAASIATASGPIATDSPRASSPSQAVCGSGGFFSFFRGQQHRRATEPAINEQITGVIQRSGSTGLLPLKSGHETHASRTDLLGPLPAQKGLARSASVGQSASPGFNAFGGSLGGGGPPTPNSAAGSTIKLANVPQVISPASAPPSQRERVEV